MTVCPVCQGRQIGKIGTENYFCWSCLIEFNQHREAFYVLEDGSLALLEEGATHS